MNRKALSPLSSTILLLVISIIIGIIVMSWGKGYAEKMTAKAEQKADLQKQSSLFDDLNERLNNGEISQEQYDEIKSTLMEQKT